MSVGPTFACGFLEEKPAFVPPYMKAQHCHMTPARLRNLEPWGSEMATYLVPSTAPPSSFPLSAHNVNCYKPFWTRKYNSSCLPGFLGSSWHERRSISGTLLPTTNTTSHKQDSLCLQLLTTPLEQRAEQHYWILFNARALQTKINSSDVKLGFQFCFGLARSQR